MNDVELQKLMRKHHYYTASLSDIPAEERARMLEMLKELDALAPLILRLGKRLAAGENAVRAELNPAIRRSDELRSELSSLIQGPDHNTGAIMYGPPWMFGRDKE